MAADSLGPGRVLAGRYRLEQRLGEGGMGTIWRAEHLVLAAPVAVKVVDRDVVHDEETIDRFLREARAAAALRSPHVVQILDYGMDGDVPFMVMELLEGETLAHRLRTAGPLSPQDTGRILGQVARAVARAHAAGIVHRDLKPENVFLIKNEDEEIAKVLDFGVAKVDTTQLGNQQSARTRTGSLLGTPYYMSPEQAQGNKTVDHRSDLWSLAVIAFECLTGKRPFQSDGLGELVLQICAYPLPVPSEVAPVTIGFDAWFKRATERDPDNRFQSAKDMIESLREALGLEARDVSMLPDVTVSIADVEEAAREERSARGSGSDTSQADKAREVEANARTLMARPEEGPALTVRQFGTTQRTAPAPRRSGSGLVLVVAGAALAVGLAVGFAVLRNRLPQSTPDVPPPAPPAARAPEDPVPELPVMLPPPKPVTSAAEAAEDVDEPDASTRHVGAPDQRKAASKRERPETEEKKLDPSVMFDRPMDAGKKLDPPPPPPPTPYDEPDESIRGP